MRCRHSGCKGSRPPRSRERWGDTGVASPAIPAQQQAVQWLLTAVFDAHLCRDASIALAAQYAVHSERLGYGHASLGLD
jgi:hypothetical protein